MRALTKGPKASEHGFALIEALVGLAILGTAGIALLSGLGTGMQTNALTEEKATAETLVRRQAEYVQGCAYQYATATYPADPSLTLTPGWQVPPSAVIPVHGTDDGLQQVTVSARHNGATVFSIVIYKVDP